MEEGKREVWAPNVELHALLLGSSIPAHPGSATAKSIAWIAT
jgi:hypothetical protein